MFLFRLMSFLQGYVVILVTGETPEKFVNMAAGRGIHLWDAVKVTNGGVLLKVRLSDVKPLRHIARRTNCRVCFQRRRGLPFQMAQLHRRKALVLGAAFFIGALYLLSSFIWFIEVKGNERVSQAEVLAAAADAGLKRGVLKWRINQGVVEARIEERLPLVSWTGVYVRGTRASIEVAERTVAEEEDHRPSHIVAVRAGLIQEVLVLSGHPAAKEGDTVAPGQILISGEIPPPEEMNPGEKKSGEAPKVVRPSRYVHARGIVRARVWYEGYGEAGEVETGQRPTGTSSTRVSIKIKGKEIILSGSQDLPFEQYDTETFVKRAPQWRNLDIPVELVFVKYLEMAEYREDRGRAGALNLAGERALGAALKQLPEDARVRERWLDEAPTGQPGELARVKAVIEAVEDIGVDRLFNP